MDKYARNFQLEGGKSITQEDLVWYGKVEFERDGQYKNGENIHIHVIVSARDKEQKLSISPNTNNKKRFNRVNFALKCGNLFDDMYKYQRQESYLMSHQMRNSRNYNKKVNYFVELDKTIKEAKEWERLITYTESYIPGALYSTYGRDHNSDEEEFKKKKKKRKKGRSDDYSMSR